jgi:hypothetical protein
MNNTNRALNRTGILLVGLFLLIVGAAAAVAAALPDWFEQWKSVSAMVDDASADVIANTTVESFGQSWLLILIAVMCLVLIALLVVFVFRQGHGHTRALVTEKARDTTTSTGGSLVIDGRVAEQAIQQTLDGHPDIVSSSVSTYLVKRTSALKITTRVRRGASPSTVRGFVDDTVTAWDSVLGREVPVLIQITGGMATKR